MVRYLKQAEPQSRQSNRELVARVRAMLDEIEQYRDDAVKRYAAQLDRWTKPTFRVSDEEIGAVRRTMSPVFKEDFAFCKKQVTDFAKRQPVAFLGISVLAGFATVRFLRASGGGASSSSRSDTSQASSSKRPDAWSGASSAAEKQGSARPRNSWEQTSSSQRGSVS